MSMGGGPSERKAPPLTEDDLEMLANCPTPMAADEFRRQRAKEIMRKLAMEGADTVTLLAWRVAGDPFTTGLVTLGMVRDLPYSIMMTTGYHGVVQHSHKEHTSAAEAEYFLLTATQQAGENLVLPPTEFQVARPPYTDVDTVDFQWWANENVMNRVDAELDVRRRAERMAAPYGSVTFKLGDPEPAFPRERPYMTKLHQHPELSDSLVTMLHTDDKETL